MNGEEKENNQSLESSSELLNHNTRARVQARASTDQKQRPDPTQEGTTQIGAVAAQGRAIGATPAWVRQNAAVPTQPTTAGSNNNDQAQNFDHLPPELCPIQQETAESSPPEIDNNPSSSNNDIHPELRASNHHSESHGNSQIHSVDIQVPNADLEVMDSTQESSTETKRKWSIAGGICVGFIILIVVVVIIIVVFSGSINNNDDNQQQKNKDGNNSMMSNEELLAQKIEDLQQFVMNNGWSDINRFDDNQSPQSLAILWLANNVLDGDEVDSIDISSYALSVVYYALNGPKWSILASSWLNDDKVVIDTCEWDYVTCNGGDSDGNEIVSLEFPARLNRFDAATLPRELFLLSSLKYLSVPENEIEAIEEPPSDIPTVLQEIEFLDLSLNVFDTSMPEWIFDLTQLTFLSLSEFAGTVSTRIGNLVHLNNFDLSNNSFQGSFPSEIGLLTDLQSLQLTGSDFESELPSEVGLLTNLEFLHVVNAGFTGAVPEEIQNLSLLKEFFIGGGFTGNLESWIGKLTNLKAFGVIESLHLTGTLPTEIGDLKLLETLVVLRNLGLSGSLTSEIGKLTKLLYLGFSLFLTGTLPTELGNLINLGVLNLSYNELTGTLPTELGNLINLELLDLVFNELTGTLPTELGNLINLETLRMENNELAGTLPTEFGNMISLERLNLFDNEFTGTIPSEIGNLSSLTQFTMYIDTNEPPIVPSEVQNLPLLSMLLIKWNSAGS